MCCFMKLTIWRCYLCHHPNVNSENNQEFDISVIIHDYHFLNLVSPKAHARQLLTDCENTISMSHFHKQILRQPQHFSGFNSHCVISYQAMSPVPSLQKYELLQRSHKVQCGSVKLYQKYFDTWYNYWNICVWTQGNYISKTNVFNFLVLSVAPTTT